MRAHYTPAKPVVLVPIAAAIVAAWPGLTSAAEWTVTPGIELRETYSDNVTLAPAGSQRSDFVTEISPNLSVKATSARLKLNVDYAMHGFLYARQEVGSTVHHQLQAAGNAELVNNLLFIDANASAGQQAISPFGPQAVNTSNVTGNQADVRTYRLSPYLRHHFGRSATAELRYSRDAVTADTGGLLNSRAGQLHAALNSGSDFRSLQWSVTYDDQKIDYDAAADVETRALTTSWRYLVSPRIALTAVIGYEDNNYVSIGQKPEGAFWSLGTTWTPSQRSSIAVAAGKRFFGNTLSIDAQHRTRMAVWSLGYQENITTTRSDFLVPSTVDTAAFLDGLWANNIADQAARAAMVQRLIREMNLSRTLLVPVNGFTNRVFLEKTAHASVAFSGARNTLMATLFRVEREPQSAASVDSAVAPATGALAGEATRQSGASLVWNWRMSPRTSFNANVGYSKVSSRLTGRHDDNVSAGLSLTRQLQPKLRAGVELRHLEKRSNEAADEFRENAIAIFLQMYF